MKKNLHYSTFLSYEENYEFMLQNDIAAYVKYNWFHKEQHRPFRDDP